MADGRWPMADGRWPMADEARIVAFNPQCMEQYYPSAPGRASGNVQGASAKRRELRVAAKRRVRFPSARSTVASDTDALHAVQPKRGLAPPSKSAQELLHFVVIARHHKQKAVASVLKNQPDVQSRPDLKKTSRQPADSQPAMPVRMAKIPFQMLQRQPDFAARCLGIGTQALTERPAQGQRFQPARSFSRLPEKRLILPRLRSAEICLSIRFPKLASSAGVAPYSRHA